LKNICITKTISLEDGGKPIAGNVIWQSFSVNFMMKYLWIANLEWPISYNINASANLPPITKNGVKISTVFPPLSLPNFAANTQVSLVQGQLKITGNTKSTQEMLNQTATTIIAAYYSTVDSSSSSSPFYTSQQNITNQGTEKIYVTYPLNFFMMFEGQQGSTIIVNTSNITKINIQPDVPLRVTLSYNNQTANYDFKPSSLNEITPRLKAQTFWRDLFVNVASGVIVLMIQYAIDWWLQNGGISATELNHNQTNFTLGLSNANLNGSIEADPNIMLAKFVDYMNKTFPDNGIDARYEDEKEIDMIGKNKERDLKQKYKH